ncbi:uncharacterized protein LOC115889483 [Sitophilus oryzae]|uniref:Uncharacterized protein LOC115889483 n=1 Tax=Sitophilus oryzae TaxID=7048 RepID=A0A6J2YPS7_SITOR|nr:uncharacterized protein LOC115889483 [Sitophilus oryzae]
MKCGECTDPKNLSQVKETWDEFFEKYTTLSKADTSEIPISTLGLDEDMTSYVASNNTNTSEIHVASSEGPKEKTVKKILRRIRRVLFYRSESKILEDGHLDEWNNKLQEEVENIFKLITRKELTDYINNWLYLSPKLDDIKFRIENNLNSTLKLSLINRYQFTRKGTRFRDEINKGIRYEWERLCCSISLEDLVIYSLNILKYLKSQKSEKIKN